MNKIQLYILNYIAYDKEPLHLLISACLSDNICKTPYEIIKPLVDLLCEGFIESYHHSGFSGEPYKAVDLREEELFSYINKNIKSGFESYPEDEGEYFFHTSERGFRFVT